MHNNQKGFTMIEVMIVVAIMAILVAIALPSYRDYILRSYRVEARNTLQEAAQKMQQNRSVTRTYAIQADGTAINDATLATWGLNQTPLGANGNDVRYNITFAAGPTAATYTLQAVPQNGQVGDDCGTFSIDQSNAKTANGQGQRADISIEWWSN